jgi:hypothetical protein
VGEAVIFRDFFRESTSWIMVNIVRTSRKPEARLCRVTMTLLVEDDGGKKEGRTIND